MRLEPRYTWAQIAIARALLGQKRPLEAERAIRFAGQYGKFPSLDYELASVLASIGLYDEAADVLRRSFSYKRGQLSTRLAGRVPVIADSFTELAGYGTSRQHFSVHRGRATRRRCDLEIAFGFY